MMTYIQARDALLKHLVHDANAHDAERFDEFQSRHDELPGDRNIPAGEMGSFGDGFENC